MLKNIAITPFLTKPPAPPSLIQTLGGDSAELKTYTTHNINCSTLMKVTDLKIKMRQQHKFFDILIILDNIQNIFKK